MSPTLEGLHLAIGHLLWLTEQPDLAVVELQKELRLNPAHAEACGEIGTILVSQHEAEKAIPYLERAVHLKPDLLNAYQQLGKAFYLRNDYNRAERELKKVLTVDPEGNAHYLLGMVYRDAGRTAEAHAMLQESRRIKAERFAEVRMVTVPEAKP